ncbi:MAG: serine hydrolase domain-containing protein [Pricia sp.]
MVQIKTLFESKMIFKIVCLVLPPLVLACGSSKSTIDSEGAMVDARVSQRIDSTLNAFVETDKIVGASALIYENGEQVYYNAYGFADKERDKKMKRNTIVQIFSMTKPIAGVALMQLYEQGLFDLDDPLEKHAPEFAALKVYAGEGDNGEPILEEPRRPVTIRDITRHTAGFASDPSAPGIGPIYAESDPRDVKNTLEQFAEKLGKLPLAFHPGEKWDYGLSVDVQAFLVERLSGQDFDVYIRDNILEPLGMDDTRYFVPEKNRDRMAAVYEKEETGVFRIPDLEAFGFNHNEWPLKPGGFGLTSTLDDYMAFAQMLLNKGSYKGEQILKPETIELMTTDQLEEEVKDRSWLPSKGQVGFGIDFAVRVRPPADAEENYGVVGEFFWDGAASTLFWVDPVNQLTAVFFTQLRPFDPYGLHGDFRDAVYGSLTEK